MKNVKTILVDDHNGNKAIMLIQGHLTIDKVKDAEYLEGPKVTELEKQMIAVLKKFTVESKDN